MNRRLRMRTKTGHSPGTKHDYAIAKVKQNYIHLERSIVDQLRMSSQHHLTTGGFREEVWKSMFEQIVPRKFSIARSVFIIDSAGRISNEVDLAIFDEQYTPYIFRNGEMKYIPIEAVSVVVQCKSSNLTGVADWARSIDQLRTSLTGISRIATMVSCGDMTYKDEQGNWVKELFNETQSQEIKSLTQTATRPLRILCHMSPKKLLVEEHKWFDLLIRPEKERLAVEVCAGTEPKERSSGTIAYWLNELNHNDTAIPIPRARIDAKLQGREINKLRVWEGEEDGREISLLSLTFQLNQLLMLINNPLLFPHDAYVRMFNDVLLPSNSET